MKVEIDSLKTPALPGFLLSKPFGVSDIPLQK
jgi:hypothetical protein